MKKRILAVVLILLALFSWFSVPALAISDPDSMSIDVTYVNRNLIESGDMVFYAIYDLNYTVVPTDYTADDAFIFKLLGTDGTTELGSNEIYDYQDSGYGKGVISFYFPAGSATVWGSAYFIEIAGKPSAFASPPSQLFAIDASDYSSSTTQADNRAEMRNNIISIAQILEIEWSPTTLLEEIETGTVLDTDGENYFRNSIYGLQAMCPDVFNSVIVDPDYTERTWNTTQQSTYEARFTNTTIGTGIQGVSDLWSVDFNLIASLPILIAIVLCIIGSVKLNGKPESGFICSVALIIAGGYLGWTPFAIVAIASLLCFLYIGIFVIGRIPN